MALFKSGDNREKHVQLVQDYMFEGEQLIQTYGLGSDFAALTDRRLIFVGKIPLSKQTQILTVPYSKIDEVGLEITGTLSLTNKVNVITRSEKHELEFDKLADIKGFYMNLSKLICK